MGNTQSTGRNGTLAAAMKIEAPGLRWALFFALVDLANLRAALRERGAQPFDRYHLRDNYEQIEDQGLWAVGPDRGIGRTVCDEQEAASLAALLALHVDFSQIEQPWEFAKQYMEGREFDAFLDMAMEYLFAMMKHGMPPHQDGIEAFFEESEAPASEDTR